LSRNRRGRKEHGKKEKGRGGGKKGDEQHLVISINSY